MGEMRVWPILASLAVGSAAFAESASPAKSQIDVLDFRQAARHNVELSAVFDQILSSAGLAISSGNIVLMRRDKHGRPEMVAATVGKTRTVVGPAFGFSLGGASALMRVVFE
jgi:hypothetical protein